MPRALFIVTVGAAVLIAAVLVLAAVNSDDESDPPVAAGLSVQPVPDGPDVRPAPDGPGRLNGLNLTAYTAEGYADEAVKADLARLSEIGSTAVVLVPTWYMAEADSNQIRPDPAKTPSDASLAQAIEWAREAGLKTILKPHVDVADETFRGDIQPSDRQAWYRSYGEFIGYYADYATRNEADLFAVGTELKSMSGDTQIWKGIISMVKQKFDRELTYAANWDEVQQVQFWDALDMIGVDAYYPLSGEGETPNARSLAAAWRPIVEELEALGKRWSRPVLVTEIGYPTQAAATAHPFEVREGEPADQDAQAQAYRSAFAAFDERPWVKGMLWWSWRADEGEDENPDIDYSPETKQAEAILTEAQR